MDKKRVVRQMCPILRVSSVSSCAHSALGCCLGERAWCSGRPWHELTFFHPFLDLHCLLSLETETSTPGGLGEDLEFVRVEDFEQCLALSRRSINGRCPEDHF